MKRKAAIISGKFLIKVLKLAGYNGSSLPGLVAERVYPNLLGSMLKEVKDGVVIVTGTNGKTTTTKMLAHMLQSTGRQVFTNKTGSNFTRGILSAVINEASWSGRLESDIAVLELDEAYAPRLAKIIKPRILLALNVVRDQLDRYGEVASTAKLIGKAADLSSKAILNNDDAPIADLADTLKTDVNFFGISPELKKRLPSDEELYGKDNVKPKVSDPAVELVKVNPINHGQQVEVRIDGNIHKLVLKQEGVHNASNATAAIAALKEVELSSDKLEVALSSLADLSPAFGRGETLSINGKELTICLVKNPAGFNQGLKSFIKSDTDHVLIAINDKYADGRDVSWLWDVDFETAKKVKDISVSGVRAYDMALRLKYDQIPLTETEPDLTKAILRLINDSTPGKNVVIFPTYTAMLKIRKVLSKYTKVDPIW